jgi:hypothetical protein
MRSAQRVREKNEKNDGSVRPAAGWHAPQSGGNLNNGANAGAATLNANNTASNRNANIGGRPAA